MNEFQNTFILGLGHQKCGTSWVYDYLSQSPHFCRGIEKEYHIWDVLDVPLLQKNKEPQQSLNRSATQSVRFAMQNNPDFYFEYFSSLYSGNHSITADITPSYCGLKAKRLEKIQNEFNKRNVKVKALILIRDPLSRIKSAVRFNLDRKNYNEGVSRGEINFDVALEQYFRSEYCTLRTHYEEIITQAKKVFAEENLYIGIYENMFNPDEMTRLSKFSGVELNLDYAYVKVNKTLGAVGQTRVDSNIKAFYANVYDFCFENYPVTKELWGSNHLL